MLKFCVQPSEMSVSCTCAPITNTKNAEQNFFFD